MLLEPSSIDSAHPMAGELEKTGRQACQADRWQSGLGAKCGVVSCQCEYSDDELLESVPVRRCKMAENRQTLLIKIKAGWPAIADTIYRRAEARVAKHSSETSTANLLTR